MMNCTWHSVSPSPAGPGDRAEECVYQSVAWFDAESTPGVRFGIARISFGRRIELARAIREIGKKSEFLEAGDDVREKLDAAVMAAEIDRMYLEWGLAGVEGLLLDGEKATPETLIEKGPIALASEILQKIRAECGMTEDEEKTNRRIPFLLHQPSRVEMRSMQTART